MVVRRRRRPTNDEGERDDADAAETNGDGLVRAEPPDIEAGQQRTADGEHGTQDEVTAAGGWAELAHGDKVQGGREDLTVISRSLSRINELTMVYSSKLASSGEDHPSHRWRNSTANIPEGENGQGDEHGNPSSKDIAQPTVYWGETACCHETVHREHSSYAVLLQAKRTRTSQASSPCWLPETKTILAPAGLRRLSRREHSKAMQTSKTLPAASQQILAVIRSTD